MGRILLICRVVVRDLRRRPVEAVLMLLAITAATSTLALGFGLSTAITQPYQQTRAATAGPDIVAQSATPGDGAPQPPTAAQLADMAALAKKPGVTGSSGPFPCALPLMRVNGYNVQAIVEGRNPAAASASVDQPDVTQGTWIRGGGAVVERSFASALGIGVGDTIRLNGRGFPVVGIAVTAAMNSYPVETFQDQDGPAGLVWLTEADARAMATASQPLFYTLNLRLSDPARAPDFETTYQNAYQNDGVFLSSWQDVSADDGRVLSKVQSLLNVAGTLLALFAITSVALLVGVRMADQNRRVGLLKAVGGTPGLVAVVLLAENLLLALVSAAAGLVAGRLAAPLVAYPGAGLLGAPPSPAITLASAEAVVGVALIVAVAASLVPALRAARVSTVKALADANRPPRRRPLLIRLSTRLPVPLLLGLRLSARRPRRSVLSALSITITVAVVVTVQTAFANSRVQLGPVVAPASPKNLRPEHVVLAFTGVLVALAIVNVIFITWITALDSRRPLAVARALGAAPLQVMAGLSAAQLLPSLVGAVLGVPAGIGLYLMVSHHDGETVYPAAWQLVATVIGALLVLGALTAVPARLGARRSVAEVLQAELA
jgi:ABC-type antimicrobial peptide transport system permease subunit